MAYVDNLLSPVKAELGALSEALMKAFGGTQVLPVGLV